MSQPCVSTRAGTTLWERPGWRMAVCSAPVCTLWVLVAVRREYSAHLSGTHPFAASLPDRFIEISSGNMIPVFWITKLIIQPCTFWSASVLLVRGVRVVISSSLLILSQYLYFSFPIIKKLFNLIGKKFFFSNGCCSLKVVKCNQYRSIQAFKGSKGIQFHSLPPGCSSRWTSLRGVKCG